MLISTRERPSSHEPRAWTVTWIAWLFFPTLHIMFQCMSFFTSGYQPHVIAYRWHDGTFVYSWIRTCSFMARDGERHVRRVSPPPPRDHVLAYSLNNVINVITWLQVYVDFFFFFLSLGKVAKLLNRLVKLDFSVLCRLDVSHSMDFFFFSFCRESMVLLWVSDVILNLERHSLGLM